MGWGEVFVIWIVCLKGWSSWWGEGGGSGDGVDESLFECLG